MENNIEEIIKNSGNTFHYRVVEFLRSNDWTVLISPYYNDNLTDKPREIDIIAEKAYDVNSFGINSWEGTLNVKLFIECKYVSQSTVFWFDKKDVEKSIKRIMKDTGLKHPQDNVTIKNHRFFLLNEVAKLFASGKENQENELIYKAINQSINAMIYYKNSDTIIPEDGNKIRRVLKTINYPVVMCNSFDNFYKIDVGAADKKHSNIEGNFNLEINYAYLDKEKKHKVDYFLIDVVNFNKISDFLTNLEKIDIELVTKDLAWEMRSKRAREQRSGATKRNFI